MRIEVVDSTPAELRAEAIGDDGRPVGWIAACRREFPYGDGPAQRRYAEIRTLHVVEHARRDGIGAALVAAVQAWGREHGYSHVSVDASATPAAPGPPFYVAQGFTARTVVYDIEL